MKLLKKAVQALPSVWGYFLWPKIHDNSILCRLQINEEAVSDKFQTPRAKSGSEGFLTKSFHLYPNVR